MIKNIDFTQFNKNMNDNYIPNESNIIPAAELIKNKSCATYVKNDGIVQTLLQDDNQIDLGEDTIIVMCSDGIIQSTKEYITKDLWIQFYLEDTNLKDAQEIADQILKLAIHNSDGKPQDDMTVIVASLSKNKN